MHLKRIHKIDDVSLVESPVVVAEQQDGVETQTIVIIGQSINMEGRPNPVQTTITIDGPGPSISENNAMMAVNSSIGIQTMGGSSAAHSSEPATLDTETLSESVAFYLFTASEELDKDCSMG